ncbi:hypothetical protein ACROYT_G024777 [Oculina patagonica]
MEEYLRIVALGNMGDETALKDLPYQEMVEPRWKGQQSGDKDGSSTTYSDDGSEISKQNAADPDYEPEGIKRPKTKYPLKSTSSLH